MLRLSLCLDNVAGSLIHRRLIGQQSQGDLLLDLGGLLRVRKEPLQRVSQDRQERRN